MSVGQPSEEIDICNEEFFNYSLFYAEKLLEE